MGCCGSASTYGIEPEKIESVYQQLSGKYGGDVLIMGIKDQNVPGKLCFSGPVDSALTSKLQQIFSSDEANKGVVMEKDKYDHMWSQVWRNTSLTSGHSTFSLAKSYFPKGKLIVKILDAVTSSGWGLAACPNMGGVESRDDKGNVTSCVDWPIFVFYKEPQSEFTSEHLILSVKDSNIPGKLCMSGNVGDLEGRMVDALKALGQNDVKSEKDSYDDDHDVVLRNTSITTGMQMMSFSKAYFPKGQVQIALLECAYSAGWRAVCAPNFGGKGDSWPCYILRKLKSPGAAPELLFASIKDSNLPGKICISGKSADKIVDATCGALTKIADNASAHSEKDDYDKDHDAVCRDVHITTGIQVFSFRCKYFPRGDSMATMLGTWAAEGFQVAACPNFGGMLDSWPSFVLEKRGAVATPMFLAVKDDNIPGKVDLCGSSVGQDRALAQDLLEVFKGLCGESVSEQKDDYDTTYELAYRNTILTSGHATFTWAKPYWPHGYVMEMMLAVLSKKGFKAAGGPNFGDTGNTWPGIVFYKN